MKKAFTLIELLVVIAIIGILLTVASASFITAQKQSRDTRRKTDLEQIRQALETYRSENGTYPLTTNLLVPNFISALPTNPSDDTSYTYNRDTTTTYRLCTGLEITPPNPGGCTSLTCTPHACNYQTTNP